MIYVIISLESSARQRTWHWNHPTRVDSSIIDLGKVEESWCPANGRALAESDSTKPSSEGASGKGCSLGGGSVYCRGRSERNVIILCHQCCGCCRTSHGRDYGQQPSGVRNTGDLNPCSYSYRVAFPFATGEQQCQDCVCPNFTECDPCPTDAHSPDFYVSPQHTLDCAIDLIFKASIHFMAKPTSTAFVRPPLLSEPQPPIPLERLESISLKAAQTHMRPSLPHFDDARQCRANSASFTNWEGCPPRSPVDIHPRLNMQGSVLHHRVSRVDVIGRLRTLHAG